MILTSASVQKNLKKITENDELITSFLAVKSDVYKRGILALSSFNRFYVTNSPLFGKLKVIDSFYANEVEKADFVSEIKMGGPVVHLLTKIKGKDVRFTAFFHPVNNDVSVNEMIRSIYTANPAAKPEYVANIDIIDYLTTKEGCFKLTKDTMIVQEFVNNEIAEKEKIMVKDITDFDVYPQKLGSKGILYLELNSEIRVVKFEKTTEDNSVSALIAGGTSVMFSLRSLSEMFAKSDISIKNPSYMTDTETELITEFAANKALGIEELTNKIFRLTTEHIYYLKKEKSGKLSITDKIPINEIASYKMLSHRTDNKTTYGLQIVTKNNETYKYWSLDFIDWILDELKKMI